MKLKYPILLTCLSVVCAAIVVPWAGWSQISLVNVTSCGPATFPGTTCPVPATGAGHLLVLGWQAGGAQDTTTTISVSDNASNAYLEAARAVDTSAGSVADLWYARNSLASATSITVTPSATVTNAALVFWEFAGADTSAPLDKSSALNTQPASAIASGGTVSTSASNEAIVAMTVVASDVTGVASGASFTSDSSLKGNGWAHLITASQGNYTAQWNQSPAGTFAGTTAGFKAAAQTGGSGGPSGTFSPCDLNKDGAINSTDVNLAVAAVTSPPQTCTDVINGAGSCNAAVVQRVIAATLPGGTCHPVSLSWTASTSTGLAGYNIYRSATSGGPYAKLNSSPVNATSYTDAGSQPGLTYYYVLTAVDTSNNESPYSSPETVIGVPNP